MRKFITIFAATLFCLQAAAQDSVQNLISMLETSRVSISYSYGDSKGNELGSGMATIQGHCYSVVESGSKYICNGTNLWTINQRNKEIYIETAGGAADIFGNLDKILENVSDLVIDGTRLSFTFSMQGIPEPIACKATILRKTDASEDLSDFTVDTSKYDRMWVVTDLR